ncbi:MAG: 3-oxoadipate enol-lactonase [uncultured bacterium]|nr:MAG: 3-oxoadipate enol-lactonase [uncultured bacterium]
MDMSEKSNVIEGKQYKYYDLGQGVDTIFFLHGLGASKEILAKVALDFAHKYRCIVMDLPGHNGIELYGFMDIKAIASYVKALILQLGIKSPHLIGFSMGGLVATELANDYPDIKSVTLWAVPVNSKSSLTIRTKALRWLVNHIPSVMYNKMYTVEYLEKLSKFLKMPLYKNEAKAMSQLRQKDFCKLMDILNKHCFNKRFTCPNLLVYGTKDPLISKVHIEKLSKQFIESVKIVDRGGHFGSHDGWNQSIAHIKEFISSVGA